ncbi:MAG TPA: hypothetical protein VKZ79_08105 [Alphaproteobacteria bacterium]|nr:hypothetical protein [Alphaproteobacteria bacterium]
MAFSKFGDIETETAFWRGHIDAWLRSDLSQRDYCAAHELSRRTLQNWRARFKEEEAVLERKARMRGKRRSRALKTEERPKATSGKRRVKEGANGSMSEIQTLLVERNRISRAR